MIDDRKLTVQLTKGRAAWDVVDRPAGGTTCAGARMLEVVNNQFHAINERLMVAGLRITSGRAIGKLVLAGW